MNRPQLVAVACARTACSSPLCSAFSFAAAATTASAIAASAVTLAAAAVSASRVVSVGTSVTASITASITAATTASITFAGVQLVATNSTALAMSDALRTLIRECPGCGVFCAVPAAAAGTLRRCRVAASSTAGRARESDCCSVNCESGSETRLPSLHPMRFQLASCRSRSSCSSASTSKSCLRSDHAATACSFSSASRSASSSRRFSVCTLRQSCVLMRSSDSCIAMICRSVGRLTAYGVVAIDAASAWASACSLRCCPCIWPMSHSLAP